jgi:hypothetical protein
MTDDLATALRTMAESEQPPMMDVQHVLHEGRHSLLRRRMAALGGGTAVLAATGLAVGVLAPAGSAGHRGDSVMSAATTTTTHPAAVPTLPPDLNPHDPTATHWGFGYLPAGMAAYGGAGTVTSTDSTVWAYDPSGFRLQVESATAPPKLLSGVKGGPTEKVPASVPGAVQAFWLGYGDGQIVTGSRPDDFAVLAWQLPGGQWLQITADHVHARADWKKQTLKAAARVVRQDRSVPLPIKLAGTPQGFTLLGASVTRDGGDTFLEYNIIAGTGSRNDPIVAINAARTGGALKPQDGAPPQDKATCKNAEGLTVCVLAPVPEPAALTAIGGAQALLDRVTSLGNDPADWTTDVLP